MNIRNFAIIAAIAVVIISAVAFIFFSELLKVSAPAPVEPPQQPETVSDEPPAGYAIPANTIPSIDQINENVKKAQKKREASDKTIAAIKTKRAATRDRIRQEAAAAEKVSIAEVGKPPAKTVAVSSSKTIWATPEERREALRSKGQIAY
ncbi:MAG: hypothetical protein PHX20_00690 [Candidatus Omnitrophica bacterium]|nr:hypothetical protein [Candidatus Omnitrophota bacterium]MDD5436050.1 hypothetical protein [Candidatus Omnitrophota bacterium]